MAVIGSQRGLNPAQAARAIAMQGESQGQILANQAAQLRNQEQQQSLARQLQQQQLLSQTLQGQRGLDISQQGQNINMLGTTGQLSQAEKNAQMENYWNAQRINAGVAAQNAQANNQIIGGLISGAAGIGAAAAGKKAHGGFVGDDATPADYNGAPAMRRVAVSPGEKVVNADGYVMKVPGKAKHPGDDERNDTVIADLRRDSIVVPRSKSGDKEKMIEFMKHVKQSSKKKSDLQQLLESHNDIKQKLDELQYKMGKWTPK
jgi:hypothetical protein